MRAGTQGQEDLESFVREDGSSELLALVPRIQGTPDFTTFSPLVPDSRLHFEHTSGH
jgi:hypothetical protein